MMWSASIGAPRSTSRSMDAVSVEPETAEPLVVGSDAFAGGAAVTVTAADVAVAIRTLAPDAAMVVGMSLGGLTSIALAAHAPQRTALGRARRCDSGHHTSEAITRSRCDHRQ